VHVRSPRITGSKTTSTVRVWPSVDVVHGRPGAITVTVYGSQFVLTGLTSDWSVSLVVPLCVIVTLVLAVVPPGPSTTTFAPSCAGSGDAVKFALAMFDHSEHATATAEATQKRDSGMLAPGEEAKG
jgi:hypothetical protein